MSETALYRKYRPHTFKEVLGQEHIVKVLEGAIRGGNISHAYLFCGTRGTGKTTVARIFAKEIGCTPNDIQEIDAASNNGVEYIRELRDNVRSFPFESKYRVYIFDEVHMLSAGAFNAFLKTLEEPPPHAIFILATTELRKLPATIVSRCQVFTFKKPAQELLKNLVIDTAKKEGRTIDGASAELIALLGDGSFRDTLVTLQKILSSVEGKKISAEEVEKITGMPKNTIVNDFLLALNEENPGKAVLVLRQVAGENIDITVFLKLALAKLRAVMLLRMAPEMKTILSADFTEEDFAFLSGFPINKTLKLSTVIVALLDALSQKSFIPELPTELAIAKLFEEK